MRSVGLVFPEKESTHAVSEISADHMSAEGHTPECSTKASAPEETAEKPFESMTVTELRSFAAAHGIDVTGASKKQDLLLAVQTAMEPGAAQDTEDAATQAETPEE